MRLPFINRGFSQDQPGAKPLVISSASIEFDHVSHDYTAGSRVLSNVTFSVKGGQTVALVCSQARLFARIYHKSWFSSLHIAIGTPNTALRTGCRSTFPFTW